MATNSLAIGAEPADVTIPPGFQELYRRFSATVFVAALRITGSRSDAEDVLQTVFLRILKQGERFELSSSGEAYFRRAAANAAIDILRRRSASAEVPLESAVLRPAAAAPLVLRQGLRQALGRREAEDAELFLLKYVEGLSVSELARMYGIETGTVGSRLFRIRQALQRAIEG